MQKIEIGWQSGAFVTLPHSTRPRFTGNYPQRKPFIMDMTTPRVNAARLSKYVGQRVRVVAKVVKVGTFYAFLVGYEAYWDLS